MRRAPLLIACLLLAAAARADATGERPDARPGLPAAESLERAAAPGDLAGKSLDSLITLSGLRKQTAQYPALVKSGLQRAREEGTSISAADFHELMLLVDEAFPLPAILDTIGAAIREGTSEADAQELLAWYESDEGRRITRAEEEATTPEAFFRITSDAPALLADEKRVALARRLDQAVGATDDSLRTYEEVGKVVFAAIFRVLKRGQSVPLEAFESQLMQTREVNRAEIEQRIVASMVYAFRDLDLGDIEKYAAFNESPATSRFNEGVKKGVRKALNDSFERLGTAMAVKFAPPAQ